ncbi:long-chain acyl-CoA synthetase [Marinilabilia salmonicolor]|jgi:long-chain acyl-CoA synthetase|uniref:AMP-dependent synthetase/ligase n=1 Tax=Marinilabilia salmonicolor TaxID=989 RepID=UPI000D06F7EB|nr:long-chain fatty acid--CoA ligase [Marinilabilia salmonicolor]PRZ00689.1 long-chain acyl-CoA synthetase [Marinilabilia salmonicolor]
MENHVIRMLLNRIEEFGDEEIIRFREKTKKSWSWNQLGEKVEQVLSGLHILGSRAGENMGIISQNRAEWLLTDLGIMANRGVTVPLYATSSMDQIRYILNETEIRILFVGTCEQKEMLKCLLDEGNMLERIVVFDDCNTVDDRIFSFSTFLELSQKENVHIRISDNISDYHSDDLATIIYSSGTTGEPKGVMLKHAHFVNTWKIHQERLEVSSEDVSLSFLPLSHVFERLWTHFMLFSRVVNVFLDDPRDVVNALRQVKPTMMCVVPRFFDKTYQGIQEEMLLWSPVKRKIFNWAISSGLEANKYRSCNARLPLALKLKLALAEKVVFKKIRGVFGGNIRFMPCAGAALSTEILKFFHAFGLFVTYGYGLTETSATVSCFRDDVYSFGTCGSVMPGVEVKIGDNSEILVRGTSVFSGYYKKEQETAEVMTDGWFHTGDEGMLDENGDLIMTDRIKDLMKTSVGKYVSPQKIETLLQQQELVEQIVVVGDNRPYVTALIVPILSKLKELAVEKNIEVQEENDLLSHPHVLEAFEDHIHEVQQNLASYEKVKKVALLEEPFTMENGTMTNTLKLKRRKIEEKYREVIDGLYR